MDSSKLNDWLQVIGIFAVVASLIFVGMQMKQSQDIAIAAQYQERYAVAMQYWQVRGESGFKMQQDGNRALERFGLPEGIDQNLSPEDLGILIAATREAFLVYDNMHFQYQSGFVTDETWLAYRHAWKRLLKSPLYQYVFTNNRQILRESFAQLCETLIAEGQAEAP